MIIWLNGAFGVGKTTTALELRRLVPRGRIFDPETVGQMLRANLGDLPVDDFQDWPAWRSLVVATASEVAGQTGDDLIAPQTVLEPAYMDEMAMGLQDHGIELFKVVLDADEACLRARIERSREAIGWRLDHLSQYRQVRSWLLATADVVVDTTNASAPQAARVIARAVNERPRP